MARRGRGEGTIRRRASDGRWEGIITLDGQRRSFYGKTRAEVREKITQAQREYETQGQARVGDIRQTVEQYLALWLESKRPPELKHSTLKNYESKLRRNVLPIIGRVRLHHLTAQHIQQVIAKGLARGLSPTTLAEVYGIMRQALEDAVKLGLLTQNVAQRISRPRRATLEMRPLSRDEAGRVLLAAERHRYRWMTPLLYLALSTGMREGELMALRWREVDLDMGRLSVVATLYWSAGEPYYTEPKTRRSRRQIALAPEVVATLRAWRHQQRLQRITAGPAWQGERFDAVFTNELGFPLTGERIRRQFYRLLETAAITPRRRFHDLRHTCATLLLLQRINPKVVSELLGHSSVSITLDIYSHVLPDMQQEAAAAIVSALGWQSSSLLEQQVGGKGGD